MCATMLGSAKENPTMLRDLIATIETLKERIKEHRSYLGQVRA